MKEAYYPITTTKNMKKYNLYKKQAEEANILLCGRLGTYKYLDMDQTIGAALCLKY